MNIKILADSFERQFPYLRLSVTDACNFRCTYCLPDGYQQVGKPSFLRVDEIQRLVKAFAAMGTTKVRLTGGEPTLRKDFKEIVSAVSSVSGIEKVAFTTNGYKLDRQARDLYEAGMRAVNVSVDSLSSEQFKSITGHDKLQKVLDGIQACLDIGYDSVKLNTVLMETWNINELETFVGFVSDKPISLRFIELMRTNDNVDFFNKNHVSGEHITSYLDALGWSEVERSHDAGPAREFSHPNSIGKIGLIAPYSKGFCKTCNRLRVSATGQLHLCLFGEGGSDLRPLLKSDLQQAQLQDKIQELLHYKKSTHFLEQNYSGATPHLASIGG